MVLPSHDRRRVVFRHVQGSHRNEPTGPKPEAGAHLLADRVARRRRFMTPSRNERCGEQAEKVPPQSPHPSIGDLGPTLQPRGIQGDHGAPGTTRTCDPQFRKLVLYPTELRALPRLPPEDGVQAGANPSEPCPGSWRRGQSGANSSLRPDSLVCGKIQGNLEDPGPGPAHPAGFRLPREVCRVAFPTVENRELRGIKSRFPRRRPAEGDSDLDPESPARHRARPSR